MAAKCIYFLMEELPDFLKPLEYLVQAFPEAAVREAIERREASVPYLLAALEWTAGNMEAAVEKRGYILPVFAMFLLAQFRESRAYGSMIQIARHRLADDFLGDTITEGLNRVLASVSAGDPQPIQLLIEDDDANEYARGAGLQALGGMMRQGLLDRTRLSDYLKDLYQGKLQREESHVWNALVMVSTDLAFPEHLELIRQAYEDDLADPGFEPLESVEERLETGEVDSHELEQYRFVDDVIDEMSWWACFSETETASDLPFTDDELPEEEDWDDPQQSPLLRNQTSFSGYRRQEPKIGRNDPCPCGSGKKYKKCCLR